MTYLAAGTKPWESPSRWKVFSEAITQEIYKPKGMLGPEERRALHWLGKNYFSGNGLIVDAGAYVGASAFCLASGVASNRKVDKSQPVIYSYDYFKAIDDYVIEDISANFRSIQKGEEYLDLFLAQTKKYKALIHPIAGDFLATKWNDGAIEILFIDIAKTSELNSHLIREYFPHLVPGRSLLIQQDFYHCWHPYIHITMEILRDHFELLDERIESQSRLYLYKNKIPDDKINLIADYNFSPQQRLGYLDDYVTREHTDNRAMAKVVRLMELMNQGQRDAAVAAYKDIVKGYNSENQQILWRVQAEILAQRLGQ